MRFLLLIRTWIINILFAGAALFFGYQALEVWSVNDKTEVNKPVRKPLRPHAVRSASFRRAPRYKTYEVIPQKNLFSSDRREKLPKRTPTPSRVKPSKPLDNRFALFGIVINSKEKKALVSNLDKKKASDKKYIWVKVGDKIGKLNVSEINSKQITITNGASAYTVRLSDPGRRQKRSAVRRASKRKRNGTTVTNIKKTKVKSMAAKGSKRSSR